jgi:hypothetical protein
MKCENCRFWRAKEPQRATDGKIQGRCHFLPPVVNASGRFPDVNSNEFCSKWKEKK